VEFPEHVFSVLIVFCNNVNYLKKSVELDLETV